MKFISGIRTFKSENGRITVDLEHFHRAAIGLLSGTLIYVYPRKTEHELPKSKRKIDTREVIISLFSPEKWTHIWKLEISAIDRPGLTRKITKVLKDLEVNIFIQESLIANYEQDFTVSIIADFGKYFEESIAKKEKIKEIPIAKLLEAIKAKFSVGVDEDDFGITVQKFEPIKFLTNISEKEVDGSTSNEGKNKIKYEDLVNFYRNPRPVTVEEEGIELERYLLTTLDLSDWINFDLDKIQGTIFSDTEEKYIIIRFFDPELLVAHLEIIHGNHIGAIYEFTDTIHGIHPEYNIISSYNRIEDDEHFAHWNVLIDVTSNPTSLTKLINKINATATIPHIEVRPIKYSKKLKDTINNLPETVNQKKNKRISKNKNISIVKTNKDKELDIFRKAFKLINSISASEKLLQEKKKSLDKLKLLRNSLNLQIEKGVKRFKFISFCVLPIIFFSIPIFLIYYFSWQATQPWIWIGGVLYLLFGYIHLAIKSETPKPNKFIQTYKTEYRNNVYIENSFDEDDINVLKEEINSIQDEIDSNKTKIERLSTLKA